MSNLPRYLLLGAGAAFIINLLSKANAEKNQFAPRGMQDYDPLMAGYDPVAEAIGCVNGSFEDQDGLSGFKKKLKKLTSKPKEIVKKAVKAPVQAVKKVAAQVKRDVKTVIKPVKRDFKKAAKLVKTDFKKAAKLVKTDFKKAGALFGGKKSGGGGGDAPAVVEYYDENGNLITEAQYNALMAQYEAEANQYDPNQVEDPNQTPGIIPVDYENVDGNANYGYDPNQAFGADQSNVDSPTYSMDQVAADFFAQQQFDPATDGQAELDVLAYAQPYADETGFADGTVPYTGNDLWQSGSGYDFDPLAAATLPEDIQRDTFDAYGYDQTSGDTLIMPAGEPSTPFSADELWIGYEVPDTLSRGASWTPEPTGHNYGNPYRGGLEMPGYWQDYGGFDWDWQADGLGALAIKPGSHRGNMSPAVLSMLQSQMKPSTYGYFMLPGGGKRKPIPLKADKNGMVYAPNGGSLHRVGPLAKLAKALGFGCECFGRDMGVQGLGGFMDFLKKTEKKAKKIASYTTPSGFAASQFKKRNLRRYKQTTKVLNQAKPYALIAGGTALSVLSVGALSPAGAAMIAGGVASLGAQAYGDIAAHEAQKDLDKAIEAERVNAALDSTGVIEQTQTLQPSGGPAPGEIPGGDWPWEYAGDGVWADFLNLTDSFA